MRSVGRIVGRNGVPRCRRCSTTTCSSRGSSACGRAGSRFDLTDYDGDLPDAIRERTDGRGPDSVLDAVGMEAHGSPVGKAVQVLSGLLPEPIQAKLMEKAGLDRLAALYLAIDLVRRGGTISLSGVYGGMADPLPMMELFDKQIQLRMGQANVLHWVPLTMCPSYTGL